MTVLRLKYNEYDQLLEWTTIQLKGAYVFVMGVRLNRKMRRKVANGL